YSVAPIRASSGRQKTRRRVPAPWLSPSHRSEKRFCRVISVLRSSGDAQRRKPKSPSLDTLPKKPRHQPRLTVTSSPDSHANRSEFLVGPPVAPAIDVFTRILAEVGRADDEELEALRPALVASPRARRDAHRVPFPELDDLFVELHPPAPAHDHVHLLLRLVCVAVRKAIAGRDALVA